MTYAQNVPQIALVRVLRAGGPYRKDELLSLAFVEASLARVAAHREATQPEGQVARQQSAAAGQPVPDAILVEVLNDASPHVGGDRLVLSFLDPRIARIVPGLFSASVGDHFAVSDAQAQRTANDVPRQGSSARIFLRFDRWNDHEARRFIAVIDKLFTVDRLGWYRHVLAMRLLLPDALAISAMENAVEATAHLDALRTAASEALNAPLLASFMPHFGVDAAWLASIEVPQFMAAVAGLRNVFDRQADATMFATETCAELQGAITTEEWRRYGSAGSEAFLALLLPNGSRHPAVEQRLADYRTALLELFGQMALAPAAVRSAQMTNSNPLLDDRLWNLTGAFQDAWGVNAVV